MENITISFDPENVMDMSIDCSESVDESTRVLAFAAAIANVCDSMTPIDKEDLICKITNPVIDVMLDIAKIELKEGIANG